MKYFFASIIFILFIKTVSSQEINFSSSEKNQLMDVVLPVLQNCIDKFDGQYRPGTTITDVVLLTDTKFKVSGTVNYRGQQCGEVNDCEYTITIYQEGSQANMKICMYAPYCFLGVQTSKEWDCGCNKWYSASQKAATGIKIYNLLNTFSTQ